MEARSNIAVILPLIVHRLRSKDARLDAIQLLIGWMNCTSDPGAQSSPMLDTAIEPLARMLASDVQEEKRLAAHVLANLLAKTSCAAAMVAMNGHLHLRAMLQCNDLHQKTWATGCLAQLAHHVDAPAAANDEFWVSIIPALVTGSLGSEDPLCSSLGAHVLGFLFNNPHLDLIDELERVRGLRALVGLLVLEVEEDLKRVVKAIFNLQARGRREHDLIKRTLLQFAEETDNTAGSIRAMHIVLGTLRLG